ncbi:threonine/serine exporter family protein [Paenibacillus thiaminolyticus]|uniref:threonine/serine exporter family protein n=1 Tax=Paenibacillus thiaminolyticus TaxID=49283 RepID=UPI003D2E8608
MIPFLAECGAAFLGGWSGLCTASVLGEAFDCCGPVTVYFVPGLVSVVPGITFYEAFRSLILGQYTASGVVFLLVGYGTVGLACGIAAADAL